MRFRFIGAVLLALALTPAAAESQERFGIIEGAVTDSSHAPVPGATVTATNVETAAVRVVVSGADGRYRIPDVPPGRYTVAVELSGFQRVQADSVIVLLGRTVDVPAQLRVGDLTEVVNVTGDLPGQIDLRSVTLAHNVTAEEFDRMPKTRTFQSLALTAPGVNQGQIEGGIQVNGASGAENAFTVDGVVTNSLINGSARQNTVFEYLQEVQVKTVGIPAEYGGALGGVISAVTKSGGNAFHGEGHYYYEGSGLSAAPVKRLVLDPRDDRTVGFFQDAEQPNHQSEIGGSLGGPIIRDRLFFFGSASPRFVRQQNTYLFSNGLEEGNVDRDQTLMQLFGKVSVTAGRISANASVLNTPTRTTGVQPAYDGPGPNFLASTLASVQPNRTRGWDVDQTNTTGNLDVMVASSGYLSVRGGYFYDNYRDTGIPTTTSYTYQTSASALPFEIPAALVGPINTYNTPRAEITSYDTTKRGFLNVDYTHGLNAWGSHSLKGGFGYQRTINDVDSRYPGGYTFIFWNSSFVSNVTGATDRGQYGYYEVNDIGTFGSVGANIISLYAQDQWMVTPRLTLNLGLRTENEQIPNMGTGGTAFEFGFGDKIAPRLGAAYDVRGDGRLKIYGSWGRYFDWTKYELSRGSFGGDFWRVYYRSLDSLDLASFNVNNLPGRDLWGSATGYRNRRVNYAGSVDPGIKPMYQDSTSAGIEYQWLRDLSVGVHYVHNDLRRTIEDIGALDANGDEAYVIGNPGEFLSRFQAPSGRTPLGQPMPKAKRTFDALEVAVTRRFADGWFLAGNYTFSRLHGNYSGIASSDEIRTPTTTVSSPSAQQQAGNVFREGGNANRAWDIDYLNWDSRGNLDVVGRLATDRPHVGKIYGAYQLPFGTQIGGFFYAGSGTPISTYVITTDQIPVFVNGRGDLGRTPALTRTDLLVSHELRLRGAQRLRLELNIINLFNQKTATHIYNQLNRGPSGLPRQASAIDLHDVDLTQGYDYNAKILATPDGANAYEPRFRMEDLFNPGLQGFVSVKYSF